MRNRMISIKGDAIRSKIKSKGVKICHLLKELDMTYPTFAAKVNGKSAFTLPEITRLCECLGFTVDERNEIFFGD